VLAAYALKLVLGRVEQPAERAPAGRGRGRGDRQRRGAGSARVARQATPASVRRGPLFVLMLGAAGIAVPLMIIFEHPVTRIVGVIGLFTFIISGVFLIADPAFLDQEET
jgi:hypothetical protein